MNIGDQVIIYTDDGFNGLTGEIIAFSYEDGYQVVIDMLVNLGLKNITCAWFLPNELTVYAQLPKVRSKQP